MPDFGIFRGFNEKLFGDKLVAGQLPTQLGLIGSQDLTLLLDFYPNAAAAYSLRLLTSTYTGDAIEVRRASDNTTQDIGFVNNELDTTSLESFCSGTNGFVTTWYDQSGNGRDASQTTAASQPQIVSSGSVILENGKPSVQFDGTDDFINNNSFASSFDSDLSSFSVGKLSDTGTKVLYGFGNTSSNNAIRYYGTSALSSLQPFYQDRDDSVTSNLAYIYVGVSTSQHLASVISDFSSSRTINVNSTLSNSNNDTLGVVTLNTFALGALIRTSTGLYLNGNIQELILYQSDQSSNRTGIETNINDFYSIY